MALCSMAAYAAPETQIAAANGMNTSAYSNGAWNDTTTAWGNQAFSLSDVSSAPSITTSTAAYCTTNNVFTNSIALVNTNIGNGGVFDYSLSFTVHFNQGIETVTLQTITLDFFSSSSGGLTQNDAKNVKDSGFSLTSTAPGAPTASGTSTINATTINGGNTRNSAAYTLTDGEYELASGMPRAL